MMFRPRTLLLALATLLVLAAAGCAKKPAATTPVPPASTPTQTQAPVPPVTTPAPAPETTPKPHTAAATDLRTVFFGYDSFTLDDGARASLDANAKLLRDNASLNVSVDGHCDERGTVEYNQALGQKRAEAVQQYLVDAGIPVARFRVISYGKERPADEGHDEAAWAKNRRVEFTSR